MSAQALGRLGQVRAWAPSEGVNSRIPNIGKPPSYIKVDRRHYGAQHDQFSLIYALPDPHAP